MKASNRTIFYTLLVAVLLATALIMWFDYTVIIAKIVTTNEQVVATRQEIQQLNASIGFLSTMKQELSQALAEKQNLAQTNLFTDGLGVINFLEDIAHSSQVALVFTIQGDKQPTFAVQIAGDFNGLLSFLRSLSVAPAKVQLDEVTKDVSKEKTQLKATLHITPSFLQNSPQKP